MDQNQNLENISQIRIKIEKWVKDWQSYKDGDQLLCGRGLDEEIAKEYLVLKQSPIHYPLQSLEGSDWYSVEFPYNPKDKLDEKDNKDKK